MQFTPLGNLLFIGFTLFYAGNVSCAGGDQQQLFGSAAPDQPNPLLNLFARDQPNLLNLSFKFIKTSSTSRTRQYVFDVTDEDRLALRFPNRIKNAGFDTTNLTFSPLTITPASRLRKLYVYTCPHNKPQLLVLRVRDRVCLYSFKADYSEWNNVTISSLDTMLLPDASGLKCYRPNSSEQALQYAGTISDTVQTLCAKACKDQSVSEPLAIQQLTIQVEDAQLSQEDLEAIYGKQDGPARPEPAKDDLVEVSLEDEDFVRSHNTSDLVANTPEADNVSIKFQLYFCVRHLYERYNEAFNSGLLTLAEVNTAEAITKFVDDKKNRLKKLNEEMAGLIHSYRDAVGIEKWLDLLPKFPEHFENYRSLGEEIFDKLINEIKEDDKKNNRSDQDARAKIIVHGVMIMKADRILRLLEPLKILVILLPDELEDSKAVESNVSEYTNHNHNAAVLATRLLSEDEEKKQQELYDDFLKESKAAAKELVSVLKAVYEDRKKKKIEVSDKFVETLESVVNDLIHVSRSMIPGILSVILSAALLLLV